MLVHSTLAQPIVHNEWAGMCFENVLNVVRGVRCVCCVCCAVCRGVFRGSFSSTVLSRLTKITRNPPSHRTEQNPAMTPPPDPHLTYKYIDNGLRSERSASVRLHLTPLPVIRRPLAQVVRVRPLRTACAPYILESLEALEHKYLKSLDSCTR